MANEQGSQTIVRKAVAWACLSILPLSKTAGPDYGGSKTVHSPFPQPLQQHHRCSDTCALTFLLDYRMLCYQLGNQLVLICCWIRNSGPRARCQSPGVRCLEGCIPGEASCSPMRTGLNIHGNEDFHVHSPVKVYTSSFEETTRLLKSLSLERAPLLEKHMSRRPWWVSSIHFPEQAQNCGLFIPHLQYDSVHNDLWVRKSSTD